MTHRETTQLREQKVGKPKKMNGHRLKTYSGHHILRYHSTQNSPPAHVGKPTCLTLFAMWTKLTDLPNAARVSQY